MPGEQIGRLILRREYASTLLDASARIIDGLHPRTAKEQRVDDAAIEACVNRPPRQLERFAVSRRRCDELLTGVERMRDNLTSLHCRRAEGGWHAGRPSRRLDRWSCLPIKPLALLTVSRHLPRLGCAP